MVSVSLYPYPEARHGSGFLLEIEDRALLLHLLAGEEPTVLDLLIDAGRME